MSYMLKLKLRATTLVSAKFPSILQEKPYLFLFYTLTFTKHSHQFIYFIHLFNKIFIYLTLSSLSQTQHNPHSHHDQPPSSSQPYEIPKPTNQTTNKKWIKIQKPQIRSKPKSHRSERQEGNEAPARTHQIWNLYHFLGASDY